MEFAFSKLFGAISEGTGVFSPGSLFANGEQGMWYEPSDFATLYQDAAGTTPVTAVEQPVGLLLDKRFGLARGPELVTNGDFSNGTTGWAGVSATIVNVNNALVITATAQFGSAQTLFTLDTTKTYELIFDVLANTCNSPVSFQVREAATTTNYLNLPITTPGRYRGIFKPTAAASRFRTDHGNAAPTGSLTIDNVSVREIPGNHATQTTAASRPVLSARKNLLLKTEVFTDATWAKTDTVITATNALAPNGSNTAVLLTEGVAGTAIFSQTQAVSGALNTVTVSRYIARGNHDWVRVTMRDQIATNGGSAWVNLATGALGQVINNGTGTATTASISPVANGFWLITITTVLPAGSTGVNSSTLSAASDGSNVRVNNGTRYEWHPQVELGSVATRYQRVTTTTDYDAVGFPHYLKFDGVDDFLVTQSINFTATDKMTVWAGVTKLSDAAQAVVCELSVSAAANNGTFAIYAPHTAAASAYMFRSRGTGMSDAVGAPYAALNSAVLTGVGDISGDVSRIRVNTVAFTDTTDQGTGNYGNYPLYIGRRAGTSIPFNGQLNVLTIRGAQSTADQIAANENYIAQKMQITL